MPTPKYFHELTDEQFTELGTVWKGRSYVDFEKEYLQPDWCTYPNALRGCMGCWSLVSATTRKSISNDWCKTCDCHIDNQPKSQL